MANNYNIAWVCYPTYLAHDQGFIAIKHHKYRRQNTDPFWA